MGTGTPVTLVFCPSFCLCTAHFFPPSTKCRCPAGYSLQHSLLTSSHCQSHTFLRSCLHWSLSVSFESRPEILWGWNSVNRGKGAEVTFRDQQACRIDWGLQRLGWSYVPWNDSYTKHGALRIVSPLRSLRIIQSKDDVNDEGPEGRLRWLAFYLGRAKGHWKSLMRMLTMTGGPSGSLPWLLGTGWTGE